MPSYTVYNIATMRPKQHYTTTLPPAPKSGYGFIIGKYPDTKYRIVDELPVLKDDLAATWNFLVAPAGSEFILSGLPDCVVIVEGVDYYPVVDGVFKITLPDTGLYSIVISSAWAKRTEYTIEVA